MIKLRVEYVIVFPEMQSMHVQITYEYFIFIPATLKFRPIIYIYNIIKFFFFYFIIFILYNL